MPVQGDHEGYARERDWCRYKATNTKLTRERPRRSSQESGRCLSRSGAGVTPDVLKKKEAKKRSKARAKAEKAKEMETDETED